MTTTDDKPSSIAPEWIWFGEDQSGKPHISFGRWQKHPSQVRYKIAAIQPTEHDHAVADLPPPPITSDQPAPGPSAFVRETAARIMAGLMSSRPEAGHPALAQNAVRAAIALERALQEAGK